MIRLVIDEPRFRLLVAGQPLVERGVELVIEPRIGWVKMVRAVLDAIAPIPPPKRPSDPPQARELLGKRFTRRPLDD